MQDIIRPFSRKGTPERRAERNSVVSERRQTQTNRPMSSSSSLMTADDEEMEKWYRELLEQHLNDPGSPFSAEHAPDITKPFDAVTLDEEENGKTTLNDGRIQTHAVNPYLVYRSQLLIMNENGQWRRQPFVFDGRYLTCLKQDKRRPFLLGRKFWMTTVARYVESDPEHSALPVLPQILTPVCSEPRNKFEYLTSHRPRIIRAKYYQKPLFTMDLKDCDMISIVSRGASIKNASIPRRLRHVFVLQSSNRRLILKANSREEFDSWLFILTSAQKHLEAIGQETSDPQKGPILQEPPVPAPRTPLTPPSNSSQSKTNFVNLARRRSKTVSIPLPVRNESLHKADEDSKARKRFSWQRIPEFFIPPPPSQSPPPFLTASPRSQVSQASPKSITSKLPTSANPSLAPSPRSLSTTSENDSSQKASNRISSGTLRSLPEKSKRKSIWSSLFDKLFHPSSRQRATTDTVIYSGSRNESSNTVSSNTVSSQSSLLSATSSTSERRRSRKPHGLRSELPPSRLSLVETINGDEDSDNTSTAATIASYSETPSKPVVDPVTALKLTARSDSLSANDVNEVTKSVKAARQPRVIRVNSGVFRKLSQRGLMMLEVRSLVHQGRDEVELHLDPDTAELYRQTIAEIENEDLVTTPTFQTTMPTDSIPDAKPAPATN